MTKEPQKTKLPELACPLGELGEALHEASSFYRGRDDNDPNYRNTTAWDAPEMVACRRVIDTACGDDMVDRASVNGVRFKKLSMPAVSWQSAPTTPDPYGGNRSHDHTTFCLDGHEVHVDYICRSSSGLGSGVLNGTIPNGHGNCDLDVAQSTLWTVGSMIAAARNSLRCGIACSPSSRFHHAGYEFNHGFCTFNGLVIAARKLLADESVNAVGVLDCDWHHGNGTDDIIGRLGLKNEILHFTSGAAILENSVAYFDWIQSAVRTVIDAGVDAVMYQAGADAHVDDPLSGLLTDTELAVRDEYVFKEFVKKNPGHLVLGRRLSA